MLDFISLCIFPHATKKHDYCISFPVWQVDYAGGRCGEVGRGEFVGAGNGGSAVVHHPGVEGDGVRGPGSHHDWVELHAVRSVEVQGRRVVVVFDGQVMQLSILKRLVSGHLRDHLLGLLRDLGDLQLPLHLPHEYKYRWGVHHLLPDTVHCGGNRPDHLCVRD